MYAACVCGWCLPTLNMVDAQNQQPPYVVAIECIEATPRITDVSRRYLEGYVHSETITAHRFKLFSVVEAPECFGWPISWYVNDLGSGSKRLPQRWWLSVLDQLNGPAASAEAVAREQADEQVRACSTMVSVSSYTNNAANRRRTLLRRLWMRLR